MPKQYIRQDQVNQAVSGYLDSYTGGLNSEQAAYRSDPATGMMQPVRGPHARNDDGGYEDVFGKYMRHGASELTKAEQEVLRTGAAPAEERAQTSGGTTAGGYTVPFGPMQRLEQALLDFGGVFSEAKRIRTADGRTMQIPTIDDTGNSGAIIAENTQVSETALVFGQDLLSAIKFNSGLVLASHEFMTDSSLDAPGEIAELLGIRLGRGLAPYLINGDGSGEPEGLDATTTFVTAAGAAALTRADLLSCLGSVDPAYRRSSSLRWVMNDATLRALMSLDIGTTDSRPLWQASIRDGAPNLLEGISYVVDQSCADIGAGNHSLYLADLSQLWVREAGPVRVVRMNERYADYDQVGFVGFMRVDSALVKKTKACSYVRHPAS